MVSPAFFSRACAIGERFSPITSLPSSPRIPEEKAASGRWDLPSPASAGPDFSAGSVKAGSGKSKTFSSGIPASKSV